MPAGTPGRPRFAAPLCPPRRGTRPQKTPTSPAQPSRPSTRRTLPAYAAGAAAPAATERQSATQQPPSDRSATRSARYVRASDRIKLPRSVSRSPDPNGHRHWSCLSSRAAATAKGPDTRRMALGTDHPSTPARLRCGIVLRCTRTPARSWGSAGSTPWGMRVSPGHLVAVATGLGRQRHRIGHTRQDRPRRMGRAASNEPHARRRPRIAPRARSVTQSERPRCTESAWGTGIAGRRTWPPGSR